VVSEFCSSCSDTGLGVDRQREECAALATARGWRVVATVVDNDVSAYSGKRRPGYLALLEAIEAGRVDVVVA
jgi:site-specific DNA recombinase